MSRRRAVACLATGSLALVAALVLPAVASAAPDAAAEPGSAFGSFNLAANAPAVQVRFDDGSNCAGKPGGTAGCEGVVPETVSQLRNGPIGYGLSSVVWPGTLAGNLGSLILAANPNAPSQASMLNSPVRAESRTGAGPDTVTNNSYPGTTMTATAKDDAVSAKADVASSQSAPVGSFGNTTSATSVRLTGPALAVADAASRADDVNLAAGAVTIGSVTSTVNATTDGRKATAKGRTVVNDLRIGGVPVTIDDKGITVQGQNVPANSAAASAVNTVITNLGMSIALSQPMGKPEGGKVVYNAGSLIFAWKTQGGTFTAIFGGATVAVAAVQGGGFNLGDFGAAPPFVPAPVAPVTGGGDFVAAPAVGGAAPPSVPDNSPPLTAPVAAPAQEPVAPLLTAAGVPLPGPASPAYLVIGLLGVGLILAGMRQLPDRVLEARAAKCLLGETP